MGPLKGSFLLGFGAAKSGTTWLYSYLQSNKLVYFYRTKEPHAWTMYFNPSISKRYYSLINELQGYARSNSENIQNSREKLVIELEQCLLSLKPNTYLEAYINLAKAKLLKKEQEVILSAAEAFTGVILANKKFKINKDNIMLNHLRIKEKQKNVVLPTLKRNKKS